MAVVPGGLEIEGPSFTTNLRVDTGFLEQEMGAWGADRAFTPANGTADFSGRKAVFTPLVIGEQPIFTWGHASQIELLERPMWLSSQQQEYGGSITLTFDDGDTTGQSVYVSKDWLWARGIPRPTAVHEDGTELVVNATENGAGFVIEVHHFSIVEINPPGLTVLGRQGGLVLPHSGEKRWYTQDSRLEIDVGNKLTSYSVLVDKAWVDFQIPNPALVPHTWVEEHYQGSWYYTVSLSSSQTPVTLTFREFLPNTGQLFGKGSTDSVWFDFALLLTVEASTKNITVSYSDVPYPNFAARVNITFMESLEFTHFRVHDGVQNVTAWGYTGPAIDFPLNQAEEGGMVIDGGLPGSALPNPLSLLDINNKSLENLCREALGIADNSEAAMVPVAEWTGDNGGGSTAEAFVRHNQFCFAWDLVAPNGVNAKYYMASYGVYSQSPQFGEWACGNGTTSTEIETERKKAGVCSMEGAEYGNIQVHFVAGVVHYHPTSWGTSMSAGLSCAGGVVTAVAGIPIVPLVAVFTAIAVAKCGYFHYTVASNIYYENKEIGVNLITSNWATVNIGEGVGGQVIDENVRRLTTWKQIKDAYPGRLAYWDGWQAIDWWVYNVENAKAQYEPDVSNLNKWWYESSMVTITAEPHDESNILEWAAKGSNIGETTVETKWPGTSQAGFGLDWHTPMSDLCAGIRKITGLGGQLLELAGPGDPCQELFPPQQANEPWIPFELTGHSLPGAAILTNSGSISLQDVIEADFDIPLALARAITSDEEFLGNITRVEVEFAIGTPLGGEASECELFEVVYTGKFEIRSQGVGVFTGQPYNRHSRIFETICHDPYMLGNTLYEIEVFEL